MRVPVGVHAEELRDRVLFIGEYVLYEAGASIDSSILQINAWKAEPSALVALARAHAASSLVFSYPDDHAWRLVFA